MKNIAISAKGISKCFQIYEKPFNRVKQFILGRNKQYFQEFWALNNVNFEIEKGESLGIIGKNGSGKSTLLQIICGTLTPTHGEMITQGRISALLELGSGFNPEFTGLENIYLNCSLLGLSHKEINERLDSILAFADIGNFIHQPTKTYSSGMFVRLAYAVQTHVNPDILIIDEALSVGDVFFQQKCAKHMQELREAGTTLLFVSHDMGSVRDLCDKALYLHAGEQRFLGGTATAVRHYFAECQSNAFLSCGSTLRKEKEVVNPLNQNNLAWVANFKQTACWIAESDEIVGKKAKIMAISVVDENEIPTFKVNMTGKLKFRVLYKSNTSDNIHISISLKNRYDHIVNCSGTYTKNTELFVVNPGEYALCELEVECMLEGGIYTFNAICSSGPTNLEENIDQSPWLGPITIDWDYENNQAPWYGMFGLPVSVKVFSLQEIS